MSRKFAGKSPSWGYRLVFCAFVALLSACATAPGLSYLAVQPAEAPEASRLRHVAVLRFDGWHGETAANVLDTSLRQARFQSMNWFRVGPEDVDFDPSIPGDGRYSTSIGGGRAAAVDYGRAHGMDGVWFGNTDSWSRTSGTFDKVKTRCVKWVGLFNCKTEEEYTVQCYEIDTEVEVRASLVDVQTGQVVFTKKFSDSDTERHCTDRHGYWDERSSPVFGRDNNRREREMIADCTRRFAGYVTPSQRRVTAELMQAPYYPYAELAAGFPVAMDAAEADQSANACGRFEAMAAQYPDEPSLIFNLGVCAEMRGNAMAALELYDEAVAAAGPGPRGDFLEQVNAARNRIDSLKRDEQVMDAIFESRDQFPTH